MNTDELFGQLAIDQAETVLETEVKDEFYWIDWYQDTLYINGMSQEVMSRVQAKFNEILDGFYCQVSRMGKTDEYAFNFNFIK